MTSASQRMWKRNWEYYVTRYLYNAGHWKEKQKCLCAGKMALSTCIMISVTQLFPAALSSEVLFLQSPFPRRQISSFIRLLALRIRPLMLTCPTMLHWQFWLRIWVQWQSSTPKHNTLLEFLYNIKTPHLFISYSWAALEVYFSIPLLNKCEFLIIPFPDESGSPLSIDMEGKVAKLSQNKQQRDEKDETDDDGFKSTETRDQKTKNKECIQVRSTNN